MTSRDTAHRKAEALSDPDLVEAYEGTGGTPDNRAADTLLAEVRRREMNV